MNRKLSILFVSETCSPRKYREISSARTVNTLGSQQKLFSLIVKGLASDTSVSVDCITAVPVSASSHPKKVWREETERVAENLNYKYVGFINGRILRFVTTYFSTAAACRKWFRDNESVPNKIVVCDPLPAHCSIAAVKTAGRNGCKAMAFVTDIPRCISEIGIVSHGGPRRFFQRAYDHISTRAMQRYDAYIFLAEQMNDALNKAGRPHIVIEGCADIEMKDTDNPLRDKDEPATIVYAGGIHEKFGVEKLARAFSQTNLHGMRLHIYGAGEHIGAIESVSKKDRRVRFMGMLPEEDIARKEATATLLVNPRPTGDEYTKYSFPSKTTEYMASGTPALSTRLPGIPAEYDDYLLWFDGETEEEMKAKMEEIAGLGSRELHAIGKRAKDFVMREKNNVKQAGKLIEFIDLVLTAND